MRLWDGGLKDDGLYLLDFYDMRKRKAINSPADWEIHVLPRIARAPSFTGPLVSWEEATNIRREEILDGEERFSVLEGSPCVLQRNVGDGGDFKFYFSVPDRTRDAFPGAQLTPPIFGTM